MSSKAVTDDFMVWGRAGKKGQSHFIVTVTIIKTWLMLWSRCSTKLKMSDCVPCRTRRQKNSSLMGLLFVWPIHPSQPPPSVDAVALYTASPVFFRQNLCVKQNIIHIQLSKHCKHYITHAKQRRCYTNRPIQAVPTTISFWCIDFCSIQTNIPTTGLQVVPIWCLR